MSDYGTFRASRKFMDSIKIKQRNIQMELSRRAGYQVPLPSLVEVQRYLAMELKSQTLTFNLKDWEQVVNGKKKNK